jgi:hypothetical protein
VPPPVILRISAQPMAVRLGSADRLFAALEFRWTLAGIGLAAHQVGGAANAIRR